MTTLFAMHGIEATRKSIADEEAELKAVGEVQTHIRVILERVPKESEAYKHYLKKFDEQETVIEPLKAKEKTLQAKHTDDEMTY